MTNKIALFSTAVLLSASLVACGSQGSTSQSASVEAQSKSEVTQNASTQSAENSSNSSASAASADDSGRVIGETSGEAAKATISNGLESDITSICMRASGGDSWGKNLLKQGEKIKKGDKATLGFKKSDENKEHDFLVKTADGNEVEFSAILLEAGASLTLELGDDGMGLVTVAGVAAGTATESSAQKNAVSADESQGQSDAVVHTDTTYASEEPSYSVDTPSETVTETVSEPVVEQTVSEPAAEQATVEQPATEAAPEQSADDCTRDNIVLDV